LVSRRAVPWTMIRGWSTSPATRSTSFSSHRQIIPLPANGASASDLADYALVDSPSSFADPEMCRRLEKLRLSQTQPRRVEASSYAAIRRYVALGYGIGLVAVSVLHQRDPSFHERSMSHDLGRLMVYSIRRRGALQGEAHREFLKIARAKLTYPNSRTRSR
jgi:DNA-binding transcriptional LysR family regulator